MIDPDDEQWARGILDEQGDGWHGRYATESIPSRCGWRGLCAARPEIAVLLDRGQDYSAAFLCNTHAEIAIEEIERRRNRS